jgi:hypothetical protein
MGHDPSMLGALASYVVGHYKVGRLSAKRVQEFLLGQALRTCRWSHSVG